MVKGIHKSITRKKGKYEKQKVQYRGNFNTKEENSKQHILNL